MKITIVCTLYPPYVLGGAEISTFLLAKGLVKSGHEVSVITISDKDEIEQCEGITVYRVKSRNIYWRYPQREKPLVEKILWHLIDIYNLGYRSKIHQLISDISPHIIHTGNLCGLSCIIWHIAKKFQIPIVHTLRDYYLLCPQQSMIKEARSCDRQCLVCYSYSLAKKMLSQHVDAVVGISNFILNRHLQFSDFKNASYRCVIPNSIVKLPIIQKSKQFRIGYIGRLSPEKGIELMVEAFMKSNHQGYQLVIAGEGNKQYVARLKDKFQLESVHFIGKSNPLDFFNLIDLLIVPSLWDEPFGRVVIESYVFHIPVLIADNGGLSELHKLGVSKLFSTESFEPLQKLLNEYFSGDLTFDESIFDVIINRYTEEKIVSAYNELYQKLLLNSNE